MKKNSRISQFLSLVLAMLLVVGLLPVSGFAADRKKASAADVVSGTIKGVQGTEITTDEFADSLENMGMEAGMMNVQLNWFIDTTHTKRPYQYNGKTYWFNEDPGSMMRVVEARVKEYRSAGVAWTFCLVLAWSDSPEIQKLMMDPTPGKVYYALNVDNAEAAEQIAAIFHYMAEVFGYSDTFVQNWRVGNEVNVSHDSNYTGAGIGGKPLTSTIVNSAVKSYQILYKALQDVNPNAKAYVSVTHDWNNSNEGKGVPTKDFLDQFAAKVGVTDWNIDFHAYPPQMHEQVWTKASAAYLSHDVGTKFICAPNLEVLTNYVRSHFGTSHRIILSEQSFDSRYGAEEQAAMIAYTYYAAENDDMVDAVIFTAWRDTGSVYHDYYDMGLLYIDGSHKPAYDVFKYMGTAEAPTYVDPYLAKLSAWTGRTISSWTDDILYKAPQTNVTLNAATLVYPTDQQDGQSVFIGLGTDPDKNTVDQEFKWDVFNYVTGKSQTVSDWALNSEWLRWYPTENATYKITGYARVAGNPTSMIQASMDLPVNIPGLPTSVEPSDDEDGWFANYQGFDFYREGGQVRCYDGAKKPVINDFRCDGTYTYYFQADGTAMRDRLTYHPDGVHVIYFDKKGHEVFSDFAHISMSIAGTPVDDWCFFDVFGYMYVDRMTYDKSGTWLYYVNPYGLLENKGWFQFSGNEFVPGSGFAGVPGGWGYANPDFSLVTNQYMTTPDGSTVYLQGDGHALR